MICTPVIRSVDSGVSGAKPRERLLGEMKGPGNRPPPILTLRTGFTVRCLSDL